MSAPTKNSRFVRPSAYQKRHPTPGGGETQTQQNAKDDCDINIIIKRHTRTGNISHLNPATPLYVDCTQVRDLQGAIQLVEEAEDNFATLSASVRKACENDPIQFLQMIQTQEGVDILDEAGLEYIDPVQPEQANQLRGPGPNTIKPEPVTPENPNTEKSAVEGKTTPQGGE